MKRFLLHSVGILAFLLSFSAHALMLESDAFVNNGFVPYEYGYCQPDGKGQVESSNDISPQLSWSDIPEGTKSFALILSDSNSPNDPNFNMVGKMVELTASRGTFYHWVVANIPASLSSFPKGAGSQKFIVGGKPSGDTQYGLMGLNTYTDVFASPIASRVEFDGHSSEKMKGAYGQYDGPCAPFNDAMIHNYLFTLYALDVKSLDSLPANGKFTADDLLSAMKGHVIAKAIISGNFVTNPAYLPTR